MKVLEFKLISKPNKYHRKYQFYHLLFFYSQDTCNEAKSYLMSKHPSNYSVKSYTKHFKIS